MIFVMIYINKTRDIQRYRLCMIFIEVGVSQYPTFTRIFRPVRRCTLTCTFKFDNEAG